MEPIDQSRGRHNEVSKLAFSKLKPSIDAMRREVYKLVDGRRCTREIGEMLDKLPHEISGRFTDLKNSNKIVLVRKIKYKSGTFSVYTKI
jgi:hypothetical protein